MIAYNVEPAIVDLVFTKGDTIDMTLNVQLYNETTEEWEDFDMTGMQLDLDVRKCNGDLIRSFSSAGGTPEITVATSMFTIYDTAFTRSGKYKYDLQVTDGGDISTVMKGNVFIQREHTA